ncbi:MAG: hypothetical protein ACNS61_13055 [Candidatus Wenzhouxiangella sp. M2_3B_020]
MLRDEYQAGLQRAEASGLELLERYRDLPERAARRLDDEEFGSLLKRRKSLLDRLAERSRARGDLPAGGNVERAQFEALSDRIAGGSDSTEAVLERLLEAERSYRGELDELLEMDWPDEDREVLAESREVVDGIARRLSALTEFSD